MTHPFVRVARLAPALMLLGATPVYGPPKQFSGVYTSSFEHSEFGGCWLTFSEPASRKFWSLVSRVKCEGHRYQIQFVGRRTQRRSNAKRGRGFGHLGMMPCEIEVVRVLSARHIGKTP